MTRALVGIGSNSGDSAKHIDQAVERLSRLPGLEVLRVSTVVKSPAVGGPTDQPDFLNAAALADSVLEPTPLLEELLAIERLLGRVRHQPWGPRTIDLDLLCFGDRVISSDPVVIPHPWMSVRSFVMKPCSEIAPDFVHPQIHRTVGQLWQCLSNANGTIGVVSLSASVENWTRRGVDRICEESSWATCDKDSSVSGNLIELTRSSSTKCRASRPRLRALVVMDTSPPAIDLDQIWQRLPEPERCRRAPAVSLAIARAEDAESQLRIALAAITAVS